MATTTRRASVVTKRWRPWRCQCTRQYNALAARSTGVGSTMFDKMRSKSRFSERGASQPQRRQRAARNLGGSSFTRGATGRPSRPRQARAAVRPTSSARGRRPRRLQEVAPRSTTVPEAAAARRCSRASRGPALGRRRPVVDDGTTHPVPMVRAAGGSAFGRGRAWPFATTTAGAYCARGADRRMGTCCQDAEKQLERRARSCRRASVEPWAAPCARPTPPRAAAARLSARAAQSRAEARARADDGVDGIEARK